MQTIASLFLTTLVLSCSSPTADEPEDSGSNTGSHPTFLSEILLDFGEEHLYVVNDTRWGESLTHGWYGPRLEYHDDAFWSGGKTGVDFHMGIDKIGTKMVVSDSTNLTDLYVCVGLSQLPVGETEVSYAVYATHTDGTKHIPATLGKVSLETNPYYRYPGNPYYGTDNLVSIDAPVDVSISEMVLHRVEEHVLDGSVAWPEFITIRSAVFLRK